MFTYSRLLVLILSLFLLGNANSIYGQSAGSLMFTGFNADDPDGFSLVALAAIPAGTVIYFSDNTWNGTSFGTTEGILTWTVTTTIPAGTVVIFDNTNPGPPTVTSGLVAISGNFNLSGSGETLYCYLGSPTVPTTFISAITNDNYSGNTLTGTGLTTGVNSISFTGNPDVMVYNLVAPCTVSIATCAAQIANTANWITEDGSGNQATNGIAPDFPANVLLAPQVSVLPIELLYFTVQINDQGEAQLNWATASEKNNDFFTLDFSVDGTTWSKLLEQKGAGNSTSLITYSALDSRSFYQKMYYRLTQTDFDGKSECFKIISLDGEQEINSEIKIFPNPTEGIIQLIGKNSSKTRLDVYDGQGRNVKSLIEFVVLSDNHQQLNFSTLFPGIYLIRIDNKSYRIELK